MNKTVRLFLILLCGVVLLGLAFVYPVFLFLWFLLSLLLLLIGMLLLFPSEKLVHPVDKLEKERARLESAINSMMIGFLVIDADHNLVTINAQAQSLLHVVPPLTQEFFYRNLPIISKNFSMQKLEEKLADIIDLKKMIDVCILERKPIEQRDVAFGKKYFHLMLSPIIVFKKKPEAIGCVLLIEDATEARMLEKSRDEFFSIASHELRTPLTAIKGNISLIQQYFQDKVKDARFKQMLNDIYQSSARLLTIVDDFLDTSRLEQGRIRFTTESVNLTETLGEMIKEYQESAKGKNIELVMELPKETVLVKADSDRLKQVIINLLGNSLKHTQTGKITLSVTTTDKDALIRIIDTGEGITEDIQKKLFTKFQSLSDEAYTSDHTRSTGLGLYISRLLTEAMGGKVSLEKTEIGKGSTFLLSLPKDPGKFAGNPAQT